ncbi:class F sortase [Pseudarthrobacter cellobiosi]|uniref:class F sortase n=1 Tax=Pseudarthrobacter cellobiosi TaxID=2953654 RepID=UPI00208F912F|nr:class F sortase [Pseudarthrobacter sp. HLT1-5]MCO4256945.1 class F sortase [Pseudarthrobacter sp. HLT1-5]
MRRAPTSAARRRRRYRNLAAVGLTGLGLAVVLVYGIPLLTGAQPLLAVPGQATESAPQLPDYGATTAGGGAPLVVETPAEAEAVAGRELARTPAGPGQPVRVQVPRLGMDIPVLPMALPADRRVNPPSNGFAYWISDYGPAGAGATNTTYLAAHSWNLGYSAFNGLMDIQAGRGRAQPGDAVLVTTPEGVTRYTVTGAAGYAKTSLGQRDDLWAAVPGRLVLVTCFQLNDAGATENYVVYAEQTG